MYQQNLLVKYNYYQDEPNKHTLHHISYANDNNSNHYFQYF